MTREVATEVLSLSRRDGGGSFIDLAQASLMAAFDFVLLPGRHVRWTLIKTLVVLFKEIGHLAAAAIYNLFLHSATGVNRERLEGWDFYFNSQTVANSIWFNLNDWVFFVLGRLILSLAFFGPQMILDGIRSVSLDDALRGVIVPSSSGTIAMINVVEGLFVVMGFIFAGGIASLWGITKRKRRRRSTKGVPRLEEYFKENQRIINKKSFLNSATQMQD